MSDRGIVAALADSICRGDKPLRVTITLEADMGTHTTTLNVELDPGDLQNMEIIKEKIKAEKDKYQDYMGKLNQLQGLLQQQAQTARVNQPAFGGGFTTTWGNPYQNTTTVTNTNGYTYSGTYGGNQWMQAQHDPFSAQGLQNAYGQAMSSANQALMSSANQAMNQYISMQNLNNPYLIGQTATTTSGQQKVTRAIKKLASTVANALKDRSQHQGESDD